MTFIYNDGGRRTAGFKGDTGDCVTRAVAIATGKPYAEVYANLAKINASYRGQGASGKRSARNGIVTQGTAFKRYMESLGWTWTSTMHIGQGCKVHLVAEELPGGRIIIAVSRHYTVMIDGVIHDTHNPQREAHVITPDHGQTLKPGEWRNINGICSIQRRCVYGYWQEEQMKIPQMFERYSAQAETAEIVESGEVPRWRDCNGIHESNTVL